MFALPFAFLRMGAFSRDLGPNQSTSSLSSSIATTHPVGSASLPKIVDLVLIEEGDTVSDAEVARLQKRIDYFILNVVLFNLKCTFFAVLPFWSCHRSFLSMHATDTVLILILDLHEATALD